MTVKINEVTRPSTTVSSVCHQLSAEELSGITFACFSLLNYSDINSWILFVEGFSHLALTEPFSREL